MTGKLSDRVELCVTDVYHHYVYTHTIQVNWEIGTNCY